MLLSSCSTLNIFEPSERLSQGEQSELEALISALLNDEIRELDTDDATCLLMHTDLRGAIVEVVANTLRQLWAYEAYGSMGS